MNLLIICKLSDELFIKKIQPLQESQYVDKIFVMRNNRYSSESSKLIYLDTSSFFLNIPILNLVFRLFLACKTIKIHKIDFVIGYFLTPHGVISLLASRICQIKGAVALIGGFHAIEKGGYPWNLPFRNKTSLIFFENFLLFFLKHDCIQVPGKVTERYLKRKKIVSKIIQIHSAIDMEVFSPSKRSTNNYDLVYVGRFSPEKQVHLIIDALYILSRKYKRNVTLSLVGDGTLKKVLVQRVNYLGLQKQVFFHGYRLNVADYLKASNFFVMSSKFEGLPSSLLEAMSCGLVPIVPNVGDISTVVKDSWNGVLVNGLTSETLARAIWEMLESESRYDLMSQNAVLTVKENHTIVCVTKKWNSLLSNVNI